MVPPWIQRVSKSAEERLATERSAKERTAVLIATRLRFLGMRKGGFWPPFCFFAFYFYFSSLDGFTTPTLFGVYLLWNVGVG
jgi:hypothetical protein